MSLGRVVNMGVEAGIKGDLKVGLDVGEEGRVHEALASPLSGSPVSMPQILAIICGRAKRVNATERLVVDRERSG